MERCEVIYFLFPSFGFSAYYFFFCFLVLHDSVLLKSQVDEYSFFPFVLHYFQWFVLYIDVVIIHAFPTSFFIFAGVFIGELYNMYLKLWKFRAYF